MAPRTTVFIPTRNRKEQLEIAIKPVLSESRTDFQLLVIDNASTDGTRFLCDFFSKKDSRFRYIRNEANIGAIGNFRKCFDSVDSPFFSIMSDDDILLPNFLEEALGRLEEDNSLDFIIGDTLQLDANYNLEAVPRCDGIFEKYATSPKVFPPNVPFTWTSMLFKSEVARLFLNADMSYEIGFDIRFLSMAMAVHNFGYYSAPWACFVNHKLSYSKNRRTISEGRAYHVVQMHRLVEIIRSNKVSEPEKYSAKLRLKQLLTYSFKMEWLKYLLLHIFQYWDSPTEEKKDFIACELSACVDESEVLIAKAASIIFSSKAAKLAYLIVISPLRSRRKRIRQSRLKCLQETKFTSSFDFINQLRTTS